MAFVNLPFSFRSLYLFLSLHSCNEGHLVLFCKEKIDPLDCVMANVKRSGLRDFRCYLRVSSIICHVLVHYMRVLPIAFPFVERVDCMPKIPEISVGSQMKRFVRFLIF